ncbi:protein KRTCAP2 homolog [Ctenocephalides felis]|uniref:protein KRTCAP2 homolog n=1 Tax=Ctenocephalides felis TaxID=7515 RepID=UPI000E6E30D1|nr:protein KRTCAP2 homolog [Ctenocephalides felis]
MAVSTSASFVLSSLISVLLFSAMQIYKPWLASTQLNTILGGYLGSVLFIFVLTAIGNFECTFFGPAFQCKLFPEIIVSLLGAIIAAGAVHRVCATTCLVFSIIALYYMNLISQHVHAAPALNEVHTKKKRK